MLITYRIVCGTATTHHASVFHQLLICTYCLWFQSTFVFCFDLYFINSRIENIVYGESVWMTLIIGKENSWRVTVPRSLLWDIFVVYKQQTSRQGLGHTRHHMAAPCSLFCRLTIPILRWWCRARDPNYSYQYQADNWQWLCNNLTSFYPTRVPFSLS